MRAGRLNKRITIQAHAVGQDANGEPLKTWTDVCTVWASITDVTGREFLAAEAVQNTAQTKIGIRYRAGILPAMRVTHGADAFNVLAVLGQDKISLLLMCERVQ
jgi:SPP1 family predicted phage head-tail adaptor